MAKVNISVNDTIQSWVNDTNALANDVGDLTQLQTTVDSDIVGAINSVFASTDSDIAALQAIVDSDLAVLQTQITNNDSDIVSLQTQITNNDSDIANLTLNNLTNGFEGLDFQSGAYGTIVIGRDGGNLLSSTKGEGDFNTVVGFRAGTKLYKAEQHTAFGYEALKEFDSSGNSLTPGSANTAVGYRASFRLRGGSQNTAIGDEALDGTDSASYNTAIGAIAMSNIGSNYVEGNTAVGMRALNGGLTGDYNTALGYNAGGNITSGYNNIVIGKDAEVSDPTIFGEIMLGKSENNWHFRVPRLALATSTSTSKNTSFGFLALDSATTGQENVAIGYTALYANTTGSDNTAVGHGVLQSNTIGQSNTAIGNNAMAFADSAAGSNVAVGKSALIDGFGIGNTAVGAQALGAIGGVTGQYNTALGASAGSSLRTGSNTTLIGYNAEPSASDASNEITLGDTNVTKFRIPGILGWEVREAGTDLVFTISGTDVMKIDTSGNLTVIGDVTAFGTI